jgi:HEAT repeat protein
VLIVSIIDELSSQVGDRGQQSNVKVVAKCLAQPALLKEIAVGLESRDAALLGDCAEVFTKVAEQNPQLIVPYATELIKLIAHKTTRVRWEAVHALALSAQYITATLKPILKQIDGIIHDDKSIIVRDYAIDIVANYALGSAQEAQEAYPLLKEYLTVWEGRHAGHALAGLGNVGRTVPQLAPELVKLAEPFLEHKSGAIRKAAKAVTKLIR